MITEAVQPILDDPAILVTNLLGNIGGADEFEDRNCIKVVRDSRGDALYFSREPIPTRSRVRDVPIGKHVNIVPFRRQFLLDYTRMAPTPLEIAESVDMLRILEHGLKVRLVPSAHETIAVDTAEDARRVEEMLRRDPLTSHRGSRRTGIDSACCSLGCQPCRRRCRRNPSLSTKAPPSPRP